MEVAALCISLLALIIALVAFDPDALIDRNDRLLHEMTDSQLSTKAA